MKMLLASEELVNYIHELTSISFLNIFSFEDLHSSNMCNWVNKESWHQRSESLKFEEEIEKQENPIKHKIKLKDTDERHDGINPQ